MYSFGRHPTGQDMARNFTRRAEDAPGHERLFFLGRSQGYPSGRRPVDDLPERFSRSPAGARQGKDLRD